MAGLVTINGYLVIEHCAQLTSLEGLASLRTVRGSANQGLIIQDNDALVHLKPLERLAEITSGGVRFVGLAPCDSVGVPPGVPFPPCLPTGRPLLSA